jgi:hypothetical protein
MFVCHDIPLIDVGGVLRPGLYLRLSAIFFVLSPTMDAFVVLADKFL